MEDWLATFNTSIKRCTMSSVVWIMTLLAPAHWSPAHQSAMQKQRVATPTRPWSRNTTCQGTTLCSWRGSTGPGPPSGHQYRHFQAFKNSSFFRMSEPLHISWEKLAVAGNSKNIQESVYRLGKITKDATKIEMGYHKGPWTADHWTGPSNETYSTTIYHYICGDGEMKASIIDCKVHHGRTMGQAIFGDQKIVLEEHQKTPFVDTGVTNTTGSMKTLGKHLRKEGYEHGYCTDHKLHCNTILAFDDKHFDLVWIVSFRSSFSTSFDPLVCIQTKTSKVLMV